MSTYSVADAKARLPRLIDKALAGEAVVITRHGKPVAELRPATAPERRLTAAARSALYDRMRASRIKPAGQAVTSVELLDLVYEDERA